MRRTKLLGRELLNKGKMNGYISNGDIFSTGHFDGEPLHVPDPRT